MHVKQKGKQQSGLSEFKHKEVKRLKSNEEKSFKFFILQKVL